MSDRRLAPGVSHPKEPTAVMVHLAQKLRAALRDRRRAAAVLGGLAAAAALGGVALAQWGGIAGGAPCATGSATACAQAIEAEPAAEGMTGKPRLVEFVSSHCPACLRMAPVVAEIERRCSANDGTIVRVNVDEPEGEALASRYGIDALPTFVGLDAEGSEVSRMVGLQTPERLAVALGEVRHRACPAL